jgi:hypothetical protein
MLRLSQRILRNEVVLDATPLHRTVPAQPRCERPSGMTINDCAGAMRLQEPAARA